MHIDLFTSQTTVFVVRSRICPRNRCKFLSYTGKTEVYMDRDAWSMSA